MLSAIPQILEDKISQKGTINVAEFMETCLYEENHGYYMTRDPFGTEGDFTTAPEVSGLFGEMIAAWLIDTWTKMGSPEPFNLVEVGPGRGTLMFDILSVSKKLSTAFYESARVYLVDVSPFLQVMQKEKLKDHRVVWVNDIEQINMENPTLLIGNELLDAFPVRQFRKVKQGYAEQLIRLDEGKMRFTDALLVQSFENTTAPKVETTEAMDTFLNKLKSHMSQGVCLFIDYGDDVEEGQAAATLQAIHKHQKIDLFDKTGEADLTTHVNFSRVKKVLDYGCSSTVPMGEWLIHLGLPVRAAALRAQMSEEERTAMEKDVHRLVHPQEMGQLFKSFSWQKGYDVHLAGF